MTDHKTRTLNWLVSQAHDLSRELDLYATAIAEADDQAKRDLLVATSSLSDDDIKAILITAIEGGIGYWSKVWNYNPERDHQFIYVIDHVDESDKEHLGRRLLIDRKIIEHGIVICRDKYPHLKIESRMYTDDYDVNDADAVIQCGCFGELVYG